LDSFLSLNNYSTEQIVLLCDVCCVYQIIQTNVWNFGTQMTAV